MNTIVKSSLLLPLLLLASLLPAQIRLTEEPPVAGKENAILLEEPATEVVITYRPNSAVIRHDTLRASSPATAFSWTPARAGVVKIRTDAEEHNVSVRFQAFSWGGLLVMVLAATVLFGGAGFAFRILFTSGKRTLEAENYPDT